MQNHKHSWWKKILLRVIKKNLAEEIYSSNSCSVCRCQRDYDIFDEAKDFSHSRSQIVL